MTREKIVFLCRASGLKLFEARLSLIESRAKIALSRPASDLNLLELRMTLYETRGKVVLPRSALRELRKAFVLPEWLRQSLAQFGLESALLTSRDTWESGSSSPSFCRSASLR